MDKSKKRLLVTLGVVLVIGLILVGLFLGQFYRRGKEALDSRPLVLILILIMERNSRWEME